MYFIENHGPLYLVQFTTVFLSKHFTFQTFLKKVATFLPKNAALSLKTLQKMFNTYLFNFRIATFKAEKSGLSRGSSLQHLVIMLIISSSAESLSINGRSIPFELVPVEEICAAPEPLPLPEAVVDKSPAFAPGLPELTPTSGVLLHLRTPSTISVI